MKVISTLVLPFLVLASCEKQEAITAAPVEERKLPSPTKIVAPPADAASVTPEPPQQENPAPEVTEKSAPTTPPSPPAQQKEETPTATAVQGQPGFVFSPHSNKIVDVRELPSGMLVADPTFPPEEKKLFRVP